MKSTGGSLPPPPQESDTSWIPDQPTNKFERAAAHAAEGKMLDAEETAILEAAGKAQSGKLLTDDEMERVGKAGERAAAARAVVEARRG